jgi:D-alanine transaminase
VLVYLDGEYIPAAEATISVGDRGFIFGDGVYEVTRAVDGELFAEEAHWLRLERGMRELGIEFGEHLDRAKVREASERLLAGNDLTRGHATVYLQVTRGVAPRTHWFPPAGTPPTIFLSASPFTVPTELRRNGATAITLPDIRWSRCDLKTVNLLGAVLAKQRAREAGAFDAVLIRDGAVTEGGATNLFAVIDGRLRTYPKSHYILPGITRDVVIEIARDNGITVEETPVLAHEIHGADEIFFTGTTTDVQAIVRLDDRVIGSGRPGPISAMLLEALLSRMSGKA